GAGHAFRDRGGDRRAGGARHRVSMQPGAAPAALDPVTEAQLPARLEGGSRPVKCRVNAAMTTATTVTHRRRRSVILLELGKVDRFAVVHVSVVAAVNAANSGRALRDLRWPDCPGEDRQPVVDRDRCDYVEAGELTHGLERRSARSPENVRFVGSAR